MIESTNQQYEERTIQQKRSIRVFVSSTFNDMIEDRNELMIHTWPQLRQFCKERQVELVEVDLRWGITEEQSTRKETLKFCLDEIRACQPFFIGLLSERYGWIPGDDAFTADLREEQSWLKDLRGKSVTELEILHGVLNKPEMAGRSFFYFRDPVYAKERGTDFLPENDNNAKMQTKLKNLIRKTCTEKNIPLHENYPNPGTLAKLVLEQLKSAIEEQFPKENIPDPLDKEARDHEAFAEIRRRTYIGRFEYFNKIKHYIENDGKPIILLGESGSGKSALLANWVDNWLKEHPEDFIFQHYIGGTPDSAVHWKLITRLMAEINRWTDDPEELPKTNDDILRDFPLWLSKARIKSQRDGVRFIVVLDALNQLEDKDHGRLLGWLPEHPFTGALKLIVSTLPGDTLEVLEKRNWQTLGIQPLNLDERRRMIIDYLKRFGKKLDDLRLNRLADSNATANPLYLKILLDELRVTGTHEKLDERLDDYLKAQDIPMLLQKVLTRYQQDYEQDQKGLVSEALGLIWSSRRGLTETELLQLLRPDNLPQLPFATWTPLRAVLEESLVDRGGILNFAHDFLRSAVETTFVSGLDKTNNFRIELADYFEALPPTARSCEELPWLLWQVGLNERLRSCLLDIDHFIEIHLRDKDELRGYWVYLNEERAMRKSYLDSFNVWLTHKWRIHVDISSAANALGFFLNEAALYDEVENIYRFSLRDDEKYFGKDHSNVAISLNNLAVLLVETNRPSEAEPLMKRALSIDEKNFGKDHSNVARDLNNLAGLFDATNRLSEAEPIMKRALKIDEQNFGKDHPKVAIRLNNLAALYYRTNRLDEAESLYRRALKIDEVSFGKDHPITATHLNNLAILLQTNNRLNEAEPLTKKVIEIFEKSLGKDHPNVATSLTSLARLFYLSNRLDDAEPLLKRAVEIIIICMRATGHLHPDLEIVINNYDHLLQAIGWSKEQINAQFREIAPEFFNK